MRRELAILVAGIIETNSGGESDQGALDAYQFGGLPIALGNWSSLFTAGTCVDALAATGIDEDWIQVAPVRREAVGP